MTIRLTEFAKRNGGCDQRNGDGLGGGYPEYENAAVNILREGRRIMKANMVGSSSPEPNARGQGNGGVSASEGAVAAVLVEARKECV